MILPFSTQLNGKPTYFPEKIITGLEHNNIITFDEAEHLFATKVIVRESKKEPGLFSNTIIKLDGTQYYKVKLHTFREDKKNLWKEGNKIDFFINCRQKNMFRFAPVLPVISTQNVLMTYHSNDIIQISVDERELFGYHERLAFAINDGFDNWEDFFEYFYPRIMKSKNKVLTGKIIHWTNFKY